MNLLLRLFDGVFDGLIAFSTVQFSFEPVMHVGHTLMSFDGANLVNSFGQNSLFTRLENWELVQHSISSALYLWYLFVENQTVRIFCGEAQDHCHCWSREARPLPRRKLYRKYCTPRVEAARKQLFLNLFEYCCTILQRNFTKKLSTKFMNQLKFIT